jgi:hypothetical protein
MRWTPLPELASLDLTIPLLAVAAAANVVCLARGVPRRWQIALGLCVVGLSAILLKSWVEGLVYLAMMP